MSAEDLAIYLRRSVCYLQEENCTTSMKGVKKEDTRLQKDCYLSGKPSFNFPTLSINVEQFSPKPKRTLCRRADMESGQEQGWRPGLAARTTPGVTVAVQEGQGRACQAPCLGRVGGGGLRLCHGDMGLSVLLGQLTGPFEKNKG